MNTASNRVSRKCISVGSLSRGAVLVTLTSAALYCSSSPSDTGSERNGKVASNATSVKWQRFDPYILEKAKQKNQPVIVYFHADWCAPCIELDRDTFRDIKVVESVNRFQKLKVDWTEYASVNDNLSLEALTLKNQFTVYGIPTIIFIDIKGNEVKALRITGYSDPEEFLQKVESIYPHQLTTGH